MNNLSSVMGEDKVSTATEADGQIRPSLCAANLGTITIRLLKPLPVNTTLDTTYKFQQSST